MSKRERDDLLFLFFVVVALVVVALVGCPSSTSSEAPGEVELDWYHDAQKWECVCDTVCPAYRSIRGTREGSVAISVECAERRDLDPAAVKKACRGLCVCECACVPTGERCEPVRMTFDGR